VPLRALFFTDAGVLRAPWRLLVFFTAAAFCAVVLLFAQSLLPAPRPGSPLDDAVDAAVLAAAFLGATWYVLRRIDRSGWGTVWLDREAAGGRRLVSGVVLGTLPIALPSLALLAAGWFALEGQPDGSSLAAAGAAAVMLLPAAFFEELVARGYALRALRQAVGWWPAILLTSLGFGLLHSWNPGATPWSIALVTLAGVYLGAIVMATGSLWAATVAHFCWNWTMAALLHAPVSGLQLATPDWRLVDAGPDWATGGTWGPEGGAGAALGMIVATFYLHARRGRRREETP